MRPRNEDCNGNAIQEYSENLLFGVLASNDGGGGGGGGGIRQRTVLLLDNIVTALILVIQLKYLCKSISNCMIVE